MEYVNLTVKAQVSATQIRPDSRARWVKATEIEAGWVRVTDRNKAAAKAEATRQLQAWVEASDGPPKTVRFKDSVAVLTAVPTDRDSQIGVYEVYSGVRSDGTFYVHQGCSSYDNWNAAKAYARQRLVSDWVDSLDDASVWEAHAYLMDFGQEADADEVLRYAGFQRAFRAAPEGEDPHRWGVEHTSEFVPERVATDVARVSAGE